MNCCSDSSNLFIYNKVNILLGKNNPCFACCKPALLCSLTGIARKRILYSLWANEWFHTLRGNTLMMFKSSPPVYWSADAPDCLLVQDSHYPSFAFGSELQSLWVICIFFNVPSQGFCIILLKGLLTLLHNKEFNLPSSWSFVSVSDCLCCSPVLRLDLSDFPASPWPRVHPPFAFTPIF